MLKIANELEVFTRIIHVFLLVTPIHAIRLLLKREAECVIERARARALPKLYAPYETAHRHKTTNDEQQKEQTIITIIIISAENDKAHSRKKIFFRIVLFICVASYLNFFKTQLALFSFSFSFFFVDFGVWLICNVFANFRVGGGISYVFRCVMCVCV